MQQTFPVHLRLAGSETVLSGGLSGVQPGVQVEVQALGEVHRLDLSGGETQLQLPEPPRLLRLRAWCDTGQDARVCGELVHLPDSVHGTTLDLALSPGAAGWELVEVDRGPDLPLPVQVGLGVLLLLFVGWGALRGLERERAW